MSRKTIIFGNGLGMALDAGYFTLDRAIGLVWEKEELLADVSKELIVNCLPEGVGRPHGEDELDVLQMALSACDLLNAIPGSRIHWLSENGQQFPNAVRQFIYHTALQFHQSRHVLPDTFLTPLVAFVNETNTHIATLNYDNLLYQPLIERKVLDGYSGALVDGLPDTGFDLEHLERKFGRAFGYYLHLHGSPLFVDRAGTIVKLKQGELFEHSDRISSHIVLTHFRHKATVISASDVLTGYWSKLAEALSESVEILLVGYSGADMHLNSLLLSTNTVPVRIVEWDNAGKPKERSEYWNALLARDVTLVRKANILEFDEW